jgi:hypothetical protein
MLKPDSYFRTIEHHFPAKDRYKARVLFRRAIRQYYVMRRIYVVDPTTGKRVASIFSGEFVQIQKSQRRKVPRIFTGKSKVGRPTRPEIKLLVSRIFILWGRYANSPATISWKASKKHTNPTEFEFFILDLLPLLGASDVRRYIETHWKERK